MHLRGSVNIALVSRITSDACATLMDDKRPLILRALLGNKALNPAYMAGHAHTEQGNNRHSFMAVPVWSKCC